MSSSLSEGCVRGIVAPSYSREDDTLSTTDSRNRGSYLGALLILAALMPCTSTKDSHFVDAPLNDGAPPVLQRQGRKLTECHYDYRLSRTQCTHHDGTLWTSGKQVVDASGSATSALASTASASSASSRDRRRPIERASVALSMARETRQSILAKSKTSKKSSLLGGSSSSSSSGDSSAASSSSSRSYAGRSRVPTTVSVSAAAEEKSSPWVESCFDRSCREPWKDTMGRRIEAHGGGMLQANGTYYWYGESEKLVDQSKGNGYSLGVNCYSAKGLGGPWKLEGMVLTQQSIWVKELQDKDRPFIIERPKVIYNSATQKYVMWFHLDATEVVTSNGWRYQRHKRRTRRRRQLESEMDTLENYGAHFNETAGALRSTSTSTPSIDRLSHLEDGQVDSSDHRDHGSQYLDHRRSSNRNHSRFSGQQHRRRLDEETFDPRGPRLGSGSGYGGRRSGGNKHHFRYFYRRAGVAMSDSPIGPFRFVHALQPDGLPSLDLQLFQEPDQSRGAFLIRSVDNKYVGMSKLSPDYLSTVGGVVSTVKPCLEGMAIFRNPGDETLYGLMSHLTGWEPNPLVLLRAHRALPSSSSSIGGSGNSGGGIGEKCRASCGLGDKDLVWVQLGNPTHHPKSFNAQPTFVTTLVDKHQKPFLMLMSDNWLYAGTRGLRDAGYIWLPMQFSKNATMGIRKLPRWSIDAPFGVRNNYAATDASSHS